MSGYAPQGGPVDVEVRGLLVGMEPRNAGWTRFSIQQDGRQYPYKCDTKQPEIIATAHSLIGQSVVAHVREQDSTNLNPHQPGTYYKNRYLNAIAPAGSMQAPPVQQQMQPAPAAPPQQGMQQQAAPPQATYAPGHQPGEPGKQGREKEMEIMRQAAMKCAVGAISIMPTDQQTPGGLVAAAEAFLAYFVFGPARFGVSAFDAPAQSTQQPIPQAQPPQQQAEAVVDNYVVVDEMGTLACKICAAQKGTPHMASCPVGASEDDIPF